MKIVTKTASALALLAVLGISACAETQLAAPPLLPTERSAIHVEAQPWEIRLAPHGQGASAPQAEALAAFARGWIDAAGGDVMVRLPARSADPAAAYRTATDARDILIGRGVAPDRIKIVSYEAGDDPRAPVIVGYEHYVAIGPRCGQDWDDLNGTGANEEDKNFGCAITANTAAQIAYPRDLLAPRTEDAPDAARRQVALDHYRKGESSSSSKDEQASGAVSTAVQ